MGEFEDKLNGILGSPGDMERIMNLARSIGGEDTTSASGETSHSEEQKGDMDLSGLLDGLDPSMLKTVGAIMGGLSESGGGKSVLLEAIAPYLKVERKEQLKRAMTFAKLAQVAKLAFSDDAEGGDKD